MTHKTTGKASWKCFFCDHSPTTGHTMFRINPKGQAAVWACAEHRAQTDAPRDAALDRLVGLIQEAGRGRR
jgi:hypothetical protein